MRERVAKFILNSEDYPTMKELLDEFLTYSGNDIHFLIAVQELTQEGTILYDDKHDSWLYISSDSPKLQKLIRDGVLLSDFEVKDE